MFCLQHNLSFILIQNINSSINSLLDDKLTTLSIMKESADFNVAQCEQFFIDRVEIIEGKEEKN